MEARKPTRQEVVLELEKTILSGITIKLDSVLIDGQPLSTHEMVVLKIAESMAVQSGEMN